MDDENLAPLADRNAVVPVRDDEIREYRAGFQDEAAQPARGDLAGLRVGQVVHDAQATKTGVLAYGRNARVGGNEGGSDGLPRRLNRSSISLCVSREGILRRGSAGSRGGPGALGIFGDGRGGRGIPASLR